MMVTTSLRLQLASSLVVSIVVLATHVQLLCLNAGFAAAMDVMQTTLGKVLWQHRTLNTGEGMRNDRGASIAMQDDCNLVAYDESGKYYWDSGTQNAGTGCHLNMQEDGNLVIYNTINQAVWSSGTSGHGQGPYFFLFQSKDNNAVVYGNHNAIWQTGFR